MNQGVFVINSNNMYLYCFHNFNSEIPWESLGNAAVIKERSGSYLIKSIEDTDKETKTYITVKNKNSINKNNYNEIEKKILEGIEEDILNEKPKYEEFKFELIKLGFYKADKLNFKRAMHIDKIERTKVN